MEQETIIEIVSIIFVAFPITLAIARFIWNRSGPRARDLSQASQMSLDTARRLDGLEQSVDAIAIEVERVSENVRYLTKVLSEPRVASAIGSGASEPPARH